MYTVQYIYTYTLHNILTKYTVHSSYSQYKVGVHSTQYTLHSTPTEYTVHSTQYTVDVHSIKYSVDVQSTCTLYCVLVYGGVWLCMVYDPGWLPQIKSKKQCLGPHTASWAWYMWATQWARHPHKNLAGSDLTILTNTALTENAHKKQLWSTETVFTAVNYSRVDILHLHH